MGQDYAQLCLGLSQRYLRAMSGWEELVPPGMAVTQTDGPMGMKLGQLRAWLEGRIWTPPVERPARLEASDQPRGQVTLAGVYLELSRDEVLARARQALAEDGQGAARYRDWYVLVDRRPVVTNKKSPILALRVPGG